jgi:hypothetical protein
MFESYSYQLQHQCVAKISYMSFYSPSCIKFQQTAQNSMPIHKPCRLCRVPTKNGAYAHFALSGTYETKGGNRKASTLTLLPDGALFLGRNVFWFLPNSQITQPYLLHQKKKEIKISRQCMNKADNHNRTQHDLMLEILAG